MTGKQGFAVPAVLIMVAVLALVFLAALTGLESLRAQARVTVDGVRFEEAALSAEARVAYAAATDALGPTALQVQTGGGDFRQPALVPLQLDGHPYRWAGRLRVSLQDEAGLLNLDQLPRPAMERLLARLEVGPDPGGVLLDRVGDYTDADGLKRMNGAEAPDYLAAGLPPPPDRPLRRPAELLGVLGWRERVPDARWRAWRDRLAADPDAVQINVNTAPAEVLAVMFGLSDVQAQAAVARRAVAPFAGLEDFGRAAGVALSGDAERSYGLPSGRFALKVEDASAGLAYRSRILFTPGDDERPIWFQDRQVSSEPKAKGNAADGAVFPDPAA